MDDQVQVAGASKVYAQACNDYQPDNVQRAMDALVANLGGLDALVPANSKVFIKVNLVRDMTPEKCGTTHPQVVIALVKHLQQITPNIVVGDSSGGLYTRGAMQAVYNKC